MSEMEVMYQWKIGKAKLNQVQEQCDRLYKVAALIRQAEERYAAKISNSMGLYGTSKDVFDAQVTRAAHKRLIQYFNNIANEVQL